ncbi:MAG: 2-isopropylmalate synthase [Gaiellales bacterium]|nr:MAG: 2-isopropylmalate synthase [Gaiellales bacterium]
MDSERIYIFDTTLRDGEQSPGISLNAFEKVEIAEQLARLGVDVIEAGFPVSSPGDFEGVRKIADSVSGVTVCALARAIENDVRTAWDAIKGAERPRIHTFISTSDVHLEHQLRKSREEVLEIARRMVALAVSLCEDVEFSAMDATRSDPEFLATVLQAAVDEGAATINIPDTVGYAIPREFGIFVADQFQRAPGLRDVTVSVHCHNDLGLAVANSLAAVEAGATQVECAVNGLGERAGNASLEEMVMILETRHATLGKVTGIETTEIDRTSRLVSQLTGYEVQPNKAVVGKNAFAHESGIHQDGVLKERTTYEIMNARSIGRSQSDIVLGKHSGRHALKTAMEELGFSLNEAELNQAFENFKKIADKKKQITAVDLEHLVSEELRELTDIYELKSYEVTSSSEFTPTSQVIIEKEGEQLVGKSFSGGSMEAIFKAIDDAVGAKGKLLDYQVRAVTAGKDALGEVRVVVEVEGEGYAGTALSIDVVEASAKAYMRAMNNAYRAGVVMNGSKK